MKIIAKILIGIGIVLIIFLSLGILYPKFEYGNSITINASPERCWNTYIDTVSMKLWMEGFEYQKLKAGTHLAKGSVYELCLVDGERMIMTQKITEIEAPNKITYALTNDVLKSEYTYSFQGDSTKTTVRSNYHIMGNNIFMKSVLLLSKSYMQRTDKEMLMSLKKFAESKN